MCVRPLRVECLVLGYCGVCKAKRVAGAVFVGVPTSESISLFGGVVRLDSFFAAHDFLRSNGCTAHAVKCYGEWVFELVYLLLYCESIHFRAGNIGVEGVGAYELPLINILISVCF